jgi:hypothetical protein
LSGQHWPPVTKESETIGLSLVFFPEKIKNLPTFGLYMPATEAT